MPLSVSGKRLELTGDTLQLAALAADESVPRMLPPQHVRQPNFMQEEGHSPASARLLLRQHSSAGRCRSRCERERPAVGQHSGATRKHYQPGSEREILAVSLSRRRSCS